VRCIGVVGTPNAILTDVAPMAVEVIKAMVFLVDDNDVLVVLEPLAIVMVAVPVLRATLEVVPELFKKFFRFALSRSATRLARLPPARKSKWLPKAA